MIAHTQFVRRTPMALMAGILFLAGCARFEPAAVAQQPCPAWADPSDPDSNGPSPPGGCPNTRNLEVMVERPSDLAEGRQQGPANGAREAAAVKRYEEGKIKPFQGDSSASGGAGQGLAAAPSGGVQ